MDSLSQLTWLGFFLSARKSLDLIESLLRLAEVGQYEQVKQLFSFPIKHCPDMLVLALLQINTSWHTLRHELISTLMPIFLGNHPNSAIILHYAWHGQVSAFICDIFLWQQRHPSPLFSLSLYYALDKGLDANVFYVNSFVIRVIKGAFNKICQQ